MWTFVSRTDPIISIIVHPCFLDYHSQHDTHLLFGGNGFFPSCTECAPPGNNFLLIISTILPVLLLLGGCLHGTIAIAIFITTRMHSRRMRTARLLAGIPCILGRSVQPPGDRPPQRQTTPPPLQTPSHVTCDAGKPPTPVNRMTHRCKTLPCPKLHLRAVTNQFHSISIKCSHYVIVTMIQNLM